MSRFCTYPQDVTLRLEETARLEQIQILAHEYKVCCQNTWSSPQNTGSVSNCFLCLQIPTKVELHVGTLPPGVTDPEQCVMKRLGYLSFNSNEGSGHQARELKSVRLNTEAYLLRLVIQRCHTNKLNIYNQVLHLAMTNVCHPVSFSTRCKA